MKKTKKQKELKLKTTIQKKTKKASSLAKAISNSLINYNPKKEDYIKAEVNFLQFPIGTLDKKDSRKTITFVETISPENTITWRVIGSEEFGIPGPSAVDLDLAITKIIDDWYKKTREHNWYYKTSYYELCKHMGKDKGTYNYKIIDKDLKKLLTTTYLSYNAFKVKSRKTKKAEYLKNKIIRKYSSLIIKGEPIPKEVPEVALTKEERESGLSESIYIILDPIYYLSLKNNYTKPINFEYIRNLPNIVHKRLYELLSLKLTTNKKQDPSTGETYAEYNYIELCGRMPLKIWTTKSQATQKMKPYFETLLQGGYISRYEFIFGGEQGNWYIKFYPGFIANFELEKSMGQGFLFEFLTAQKSKTQAQQLPKPEYSILAMEPKQETHPTQPQTQIAKQGTKGVFINYTNTIAANVKIAGTFNNWQPELMQKVGNKFTIMLDLEPSKYFYKLIVDGVWQLDTTNPVKETDDKGNDNSVLVVK